MKVILKKPLAGKGKVGDVIEVSGGYAQNFLLPKGIAIMADAKALNENKNAKTAADFHYEQKVENFRTIAAKLNNLVIEFKAKVGENGKMFGSVTKNEIVDELKNRGFDIDKKQICDFDAIKTVGMYDIEIRFIKEVSAKIRVNVV